MDIIINNDATKIKHGGQKAKRISVDTFKKELLAFLQKYNPYDKIDVKTFMSSNDPLDGRTDKSSLGGCFCEAIRANNIVTKDLSKIEFGYDNGCQSRCYSSDTKHYPPEFMGLNVTEHGLPFIGACMCSDEEWTMVYFIIYFDGKNMRGYIPYYTNTYNPITKAAFGINYQDEDEQFMNSIGKTTDDFNDIKPDVTKLLFDINNRITMIP